MNVVAVKTAEQIEQEAIILDKRRKKTLKLINNAKSNEIYGMEIEKQLISERNIQILHEELLRLADLDSVKLGTLVELVTEHLQVHTFLNGMGVWKCYRFFVCLQMALFGCEADMGICTDSGARMIEYFGDANYRRKVKRGESVCFSAMVS